MILYSESFPSAIARASPGIYIFIMMGYMILIQSTQAIYLFLALVCVFISNWIFKNFIFQPLYHLVSITTGQNSLPILGIGSRPPGAVSSGLFLDGQPGNTTFGMPSGHSQITWAIGTYLILNLVNRQNSICNFVLIISIFYWMCYVSYSRVYIANCHTIQQVIIGGLIGIGSGFIIWKLESIIVKWLKALKISRMW